MIKEQSRKISFIIQRDDLAITAGEGEASLEGTGNRACGRSRECSVKR